MMVGITSWQQQVPTPQPYTGANAWQIPAHPTLAATPISAKTSLYRGAIALAVNGVPIFNALNNRGDDAYLAGELDQWGGHSGRADDYHYHIAPLHLQTVVGTAKPIAYALDGFPLYGTTEADGSAVTGLDEFNGHLDAAGQYHYHGTLTYPYINGGLHGVAHVVDDQIDPQPVTRPFRPDGAPLTRSHHHHVRDHRPNAYRLEYSLAGHTGLVEYTVNDTAVSFVFTDPRGTCPHRDLRSDQRMRNVIGPLTLAIAIAIAAPGCGSDGTTTATSAAPAVTSTITSIPSSTSADSDRNIRGRDRRSLGRQLVRAVRQRTQGCRRQRTDHPSAIVQRRHPSPSPPPTP